MKESIFPVGAISRIRMGTDGDGITTLVAAAGCPMACKYCLNPTLTSQQNTKQWLTPSELLDIVEIDHLYFLATGGGIAFGGGEPLLHSSFICKFCEICPSEWNITIETALHVPEEHIRRIARTRARFLVDIKSLDPETYFSYTQKPLALAQANLKLLLELTGPERITVRIPVIPGFVNVQQQTETCRILGQWGFSSLETFCYKIKTTNALQVERE